MNKNHLAKIFLTLLIMLFSKKVYAAVSFSEIAWMGGPNSSADEWIELFNSGDALSIDGYVIESQSKKLSINLSGSIEKNDYYLIERTDDDSVPGITADLVASFGTGLNNAGDDIYLKDPNGNIIDSLLFSSGWPAGDNTTKETMQKISGSWLTAKATPKKPASGEIVTDKKTTDENTATSVGGIGSSIAGAPAKPKPDLSNFEIRLLNDAFTLSKIKFEIIDVDQAGTPIFYNVYKVNFGDGVEQSFKYNENIEHTYRYPGFYKVTVKKFTSSWSAVALKQNSIILHIENAQIEIDTSRAPILVVKNTSDKDIDLSQFVFTKDLKSFTPPVGSVVFAGKELWLAPEVTNFNKDDVLALNIISSSGFNIYTSAQPYNETYFAASVPNKKTPTRNSVKNLNNLNNQDILNNPLPLGTELLAQANSAEIFNNQKQSKSFVWILFFALIIFGSFVFIKIRNKQIPESEEFTFLEE